jgi:hypothetical protein
MKVVEGAYVYSAMDRKSRPQENVRWKPLNFIKSSFASLLRIIIALLILLKVCFLVA